jgi:hypothetical protein
MGSVAKPRCARGERCTQYRFLDEPAKLRSSSRSNLCDRCLQESASSTSAYRHTGWEFKVDKAIKAASLERPHLRVVGRGSLRDLLELNWRNGEKGRFSDLGVVLERLDSKTLYKVSDQLDTDREELTRDYGHNRWLHLRTHVRLNAWLKQLPVGMSLSPDMQDGLPIQVVAIRTDGKKWDFNIPIRAELLRLVRRYYSQEDYAKLLGIRRGFYRKMRARMDQGGFTLRKFTTEELERFVRGAKRGRKSRPKESK